MQVSFPFQISSQGRSATTGQEKHIEHLIEQVLFTAPGERVNRPEFGTSLLDFVFAPAGDELMAATKFMIQGSLQQQLNHLIQVQDIHIESEDACLQITIQYLVLENQHQAVAQFKRTLNAVMP